MLASSHWHSIEMTLNLYNFASILQIVQNIQVYLSG